MENKYFWMLVVSVSLLVAFFLSAGSGVPAILGRTVGLIIFPGIIALIISGVARLFKKKLSDSEFNNVFLGIWILGLLLQIVAVAGS